MFRSVPDFSSWASGLSGTEWLRGHELWIPRARIASMQILSGSFLSRILMYWPPTHFGHLYLSGVAETAQRLAPNTDHILTPRGGFTKIRNSESAGQCKTVGLSGSGHQAEAASFPACGVMTCSFCWSLIMEPPEE